MIDNAQAAMAYNTKIAIEQISGVNDNMSRSHYHEYYEFYFLDSGERFHILDSSIHHAKSGDILLFAPLTMHHSYGAKDVPFSRIVLYFRPEMLQYPSLLSFLQTGSGLYRPEPHTLHAIRRYLFSLMELQQQGGYQEERMQALLNVLLFHLLEVTPSVSDVKIQSGTHRIKSIIEYINANYQNEITLSQLSERFYISQYHLCREFKKYTNTTIINYINRNRIMNAQRLFLETNANVSEVCAKTGFSNLTHFNRVFKEITKMTPSAYRQKSGQLHREGRDSLEASGDESHIRSLQGLP